MRWLHISDIHYSPPGKDYDTYKMLEKLYDCITRDHIKVQEVFFSGDFRFAKPPCTVTPEQVAGELRKIARLAGVTDPANIHIVPGNHDLTRDEDENTTPLLDRVYEQYKDNGAFIGKLNKKGREILCQKYLLKRFRFFYKVARELNDPVWNDPKKLHHYRKQGSCRIVYLNTAVACGRKNERGGLVIGYKDLYEELHRVHVAFTAAEQKLPGIALGHHGLYCLSGQERNKIKELFKDFNISLYLCGDAHFGDDAVFDGFTQITAGCLKKDAGTENAFFVGTISENGGTSIQAYTYDHNHFGWNENSVFSAQINKNFGPVTPKPIIKTRGKAFGRDVIVNRVMEKLSKSAGNYAVAVVGAPGIGKSTVCRTVITQIGAQKYTEVDMSGQMSKIAALSSILRAFGVEYSEDLEEDIKKIISTKHGYTVYFDNMEDPLNDKEFEEWLYSFISFSGWNILYSSRKKHLNSMINNIPVPPLDLPDAKLMFLDLWEDTLSDSAQKKLDELLNDLDCHPLAIKLVAAQKWRLPTIEALLAAWNENESHSDMIIDDEKGSHSSWHNAVRMSFNAVADSKESLTLWGVISYLPSVLSRALFRHIFVSNLDAYEKAALILLKNGLLEAVDINEASNFGYSMLRPIKDVAFVFDSTNSAIARELLRQAFFDYFTTGNQFSHPDRAKGHILALEVLPTALSFLDKTLMDEGLNETLIRSMNNYFKYAAPLSLKILETLAIGQVESRLLAFLSEYLGDLESRLGQIEDAQTHYADAEQLYRAERVNLGLANVLLARGDLERVQQNYPAAIDSYNIALGLYEAEQEPQGMSFTMGELCKVYALAGNSGEALYWLERVAEKFAGMPEYVKPYVANCIKEALELLVTK